MSIVSWMEEFYSKDAVELANYDGVTDLDLVRHSLKKWQGALPENLVRHNVGYKSHTIYQEDSEFYFDRNSCSLCVFDNHSNCRTCPILSVTGKTCDIGNFFCQGSMTWNNSGDTPEPMIRLLEKVKCVLEKTNDNI